MPTATSSNVSWAVAAWRSPGLVWAQLDTRSTRRRQNWHARPGVALPCLAGAGGVLLPVIMIVGWLAAGLNLAYEYRFTGYGEMADFLEQKVDLPEEPASWLS